MLDSENSERIHWLNGVGGWSNRFIGIDCRQGQGHRTLASGAAKARGRAKLRWDSVNGADAYIVICDGKEITRPFQIEGSQKEWTDKGGL
jgi:hypothetical protein